MGSIRPFGNIRELKSGRYQARYWHLGKQVAADTTFATKAEARSWLATMEADILGGRHVNPSSGREPFGAYAARWLEQRELRPRTRDTYASRPPTSSAFPKPRPLHAHSEKTPRHSEPLVASASPFATSTAS